MTRAIVEVDGRAGAEVEPDTMVVSVDVEVGGETATAARDRERERRETLRDALGDVVHEDDVCVTSRYVGQTANAFDTTVDAAYAARSALDVRCRPGVLEAVVGAATDAGAVVESVEPQVDEARRESIRTDLLEAATANAREQAETLAAAAGSRVGSVRSLSTAEAEPFSSIVDEITATDVSADYSAGPMEFVVSVEATYELASSADPSGN